MTQLLNISKKSTRRKEGDSVCVWGGITELTDGIISLCVAHGAYLAFGSDMWLTGQPGAKSECEMLGYVYCVIWQGEQERAVPNSTADLE